jgi:hypothetical protein
MTVLAFLFVAVAVVAGGVVLALVALVITQVQRLRRFRAPTLCAIVGGVVGCYAGFCCGFAAVILVGIVCMGVVAIRVVSQCEPIGELAPTLLVGLVVVGAIIGSVVGTRVRRWLG